MVMEQNCVGERFFLKHHTLLVIHQEIIIQKIGSVGSTFKTSIGPSDSRWRFQEHPLCHKGTTQYTVVSSVAHVIT